MKTKFIRYTLAAILMGGALVGCNAAPVVEAEKYTVTYDANGGNGTAPVDSNQYEKGAKVTVLGNTFTAPEGKEFINWNEEADASGRYYNVDSSFKIYENITLYAQWLEKQEINFDGPNTIKVDATSGINYTLSHNKAEEGTVVTLTINLADGIILGGAPTSKDVTLTTVNASTYTFVMPKKPVNITVRGTINGDVVLTGDIAAELKDPDHDGIYTAEIDLNDNNKTSYQFTYVIKDSNGIANRLSSLNLDETRCDANVTFTANKENELMICGGCKYLFCYDSTKADYNCFITREKINYLPTTTKTLYNLFDGKMRSQSTIHPQGLTSINYKKVVTGNDTEQGYKITNEEYNYKKISDTESFATSQDKINNKTEYVYKNIDTTKNVYSIINTYTKEHGNNEASDNVWTLDPYGYMQEGGRNFPYSAKQDIVEDSKYRDTSRYEITGREAYRNVSMAAHYGADLEYEMWKATRGDYDGTAAINAANAEGSHIDLKSEATNDGFKVTIKSTLEYNHEESGSTADVTQQYAYVYDITMNFFENGDLVDLDYKEDYYSKANWNFSAHTGAVGVTPITTTIKVTNGYDETYTRNAVLGSFDPSAYFISSISKLSFYNEKAGTKSSTTSLVNFDDELLIYDYLGGEDPTKLVDEFEFAPSTALDAWQYGFIGSSDEGVAANTVYGPKAVGVGTCTVTFGNHLKNLAGATKDVNITVCAGGQFNGLFVNALKTGYDSYDTPHADYIYGFAGKEMKFFIDSSNNTGCPVSYWVAIRQVDVTGWATYVSSSQYFTIKNGVGTQEDSDLHGTFTRVVGNDLILDFNTDAANALTKPVTVDIILRSEFYKEGFGPTTLHVVVGVKQESIINTKWKTEYKYDSTENPGLKDKKFEDATIEFKSAGEGIINETLYTETGAIKCKNTYNFRYTEANNGKVTGSITSVTAGEAGLPTSAYSYTLYFERQLDGTLGVCLYAETTDDYHEIFGLISLDDEGVTIEGLTVFERTNA